MNQGPQWDCTNVDPEHESTQNRKLLTMLHQNAGLTKSTKKETGRLRIAKLYPLKTQIKNLHLLLKKQRKTKTERQIQRNTTKCEKQTTKERHNKQTHKDITKNIDKTPLLGLLCITRLFH